ncbi:unnamed protein product [Leptidea sinapis]|uniref:Uncharacterized protein n=1 Tax=Leptidea sinapis TaxID=189913 RepID=A0A5E4Q4H8_9NEOP|nr:unnamed protein product [Leptidea sinapis]
MYLLASSFLVQLTNSLPTSSPLNFIADIDQKNSSTLYTCLQIIYYEKPMKAFTVHDESFFYPRLNDSHKRRRKRKILRKDEMKHYVGNVELPEVCCQVALRIDLTQANVPFE